MILQGEFLLIGKACDILVIVTVMQGPNIPMKEPWLITMCTCVSSKQVLGMCLPIKELSTILETDEALLRVCLKGTILSAQG